MKDMIKRQDIWGAGNLPEAVRKTRDAKHEIMGMLMWMKQDIDQIEERVKGTPEINDEQHAQLVEAWAVVVHEAEKALSEAMTFGII